MNASHILLRPYNEAEIEDLCLLERRAHRRYLSLVEYTKFATGPAINPERFRTGTTMVAEFAGHRAGYIIVQPLDDILYIANLMVDEEMSGKGIGQCLLGWAESYASAARISGTCLTTFRVPRWNGPWYMKHGYVEMPERRIGPSLQSILVRHAVFLDMKTRIVMWKPIHAPAE